MAKHMLLIKFQVSTIANNIKMRALSIKYTVIPTKVNTNETKYKNTTIQKSYE